jgi:transposase-like protein
VTARSASALSGYRFPDEVIALAVGWYLRYRLSYADLAELLAERGVVVDPSPLYDWVQAFAPRFVAAARAHRSPVTTKWFVDETLRKLGRRWRYVFRAIDEAGQIIDVYLSDHQHLKGRVRPMRRFKRVGTASTFCRGHALIRNLRQGFSTLTAAIAPRRRLATAWPVLAATL